MVTIADDVAIDSAMSTAGRRGLVAAVLVLKVPLPLKFAFMMTKLLSFGDDRKTPLGKANSSMVQKNAKMYTSETQIYQL